MKQKLPVVLCCILFSLNILGSHIVGGELFMTNKNNYKYNIGLKLYFDDIYGEKTILKNEKMIVVNLYRKSDNALMEILQIPESQNYLISYNNPACARGNDVQTRIILYKKDFDLDPEKYNDPAGYYMVWERCCRNENITNLKDPDKQGNIFYLEFPPTIINGVKLTNSSPYFPDIKGDYACVNQPFVFDFGATDADGDQIKYYLSTPFNTATDAPGGIQQLSDGTFILTNINTPAPYEGVKWYPGYGIDNIIPVASASDQIKINEQTGLITFTANLLGLFVFSVKCEEWRGNIKIGEVHRDFQIKVLDCQLNQPPSGFIKNKNVKVADNGLILIKPADPRCFNVYQSDNFTNTDQTNSNLQIKILQTDFDLNLVSLSPLSGTVSLNNDTTISRLCWKNCAKSPPGNPFHVVLVVSDQGCPFPKTDTIRAQFEMDSLPNVPSSISTSLPNNKDSVVAGNTLSFTVSGTDPDFDFISLEAQGRGFNLADYDMNFNAIAGNDSLGSVFNWVPHCEVPINKDLLVDLILKEKRCNDIIFHNKTITLRFKPKPGFNPTISLRDSIGNLHTKKYYVDKYVGDSIHFEIVGKDLDINDPIYIKAIPHGFVLKEAGMLYETPKEGVGIINVPFDWKITCDKLDKVKDNTFIIDFVIEDNSCRPDRFDTLTTTLHIKDYKANYDFLPYNVFTPNGDSSNEYFTMPNLPPDNCQDRFNSIEIYNRWGKEVYKSHDRKFKWRGEDFSSGTYYYAIYYQRRTYRGWVGLLK